MDVFFNHVGKQGSDQHFPLTIANKVSIRDLKHALNGARSSLVQSPEDAFPEGEFNAWGVPSGAASVIKDLKPGDLMFLVEHTSGDGSLPVYGQIRVAAVAEQLSDVSQFLWGDPKYVYPFFFDARFTNLTWFEFREKFGYDPNFKPRGTTHKVQRDRIAMVGGFEELLRWVGAEAGSWQGTKEADGPYDDPSSLPPGITEDLLQLLGQEPQLCDSAEEEFAKRQKRLANFRKSILSIYRFKCCVCGEGMIGNHGEIEVHAAHIYPRHLLGADDVRNGVAMCARHHWAFDVGLFSFGEDAKIVLSPKTPRTTPFDALLKFEGRPIAIPSDQRMSPHPLFIRHRNSLMGF